MTNIQDKANKNRNKNRNKNKNKDRSKSRNRNKNKSKSKNKNRNRNENKDKNKEPKHAHKVQESGGMLNDQSRKVKDTTTTIETKVDSILSKFEENKIAWVYLTPILTILCISSCNTGKNICFFVYVIFIPLSIICYIQTVANKDKAQNLYNNIKYNKYFWIVLLSSTIFLSLRYGQEDTTKFKIYSGIVTLVLSIMVGWYTHYLSHSIDYSKLYTDFLKSKQYTSRLFHNLPNELHYYIYSIAYWTDFHSKNTPQKRY